MLTQTVCPDLRKQSLTESGLFLAYTYFLFSNRFLQNPVQNFNFDLNNLLSESDKIKVSQPIPWLTLFSSNNIKID
jgi:hypothetical protein